MSEATTASSRPPRWLLGVLIAMASMMAFRLSGGLGQSLWRDEAATASAAARSLVDLFRLFENAEGGLAGYLVFMNLWSGLAGTSEVALRLPSLVAAMVTVVATGALASRLGGPTAGLVAGLFLVVHPQLMPYYALEARPYSLATALIVVAALLALRASRARDDGRLDSTLWAVVASAAVTCHLLAVLPLAPQVLWLRASRRGSDRAALAMTIALPIATTLLMTALASRVSVLQSWIAPVSPGSALNVARWILSRPGEVVLIAALPGLLLLGRAGSAARLLRPRRLDVVVAVLWATGPLLLLTAFSILVRPVLIYRYVLPSIVGVAVLVGLATSASFAASRAGRGLAIFRWVAVGALVCGGIAALHPKLNRDLLQPLKKPGNLRAATEWLLDHDLPGDRILYAPTWAESGFEWYLDRLGGGAEPVDLTAVPMASASEAAALWTPTVELKTARARLAALDRVWIAGYPLQGSWQPVPELGAPLAAVVRNCWVRTEKEHFGVSLELWKRPVGDRKRPGCD